jgi:spore coat protein U-like protein
MTIRTAKLVFAATSLAAALVAGTPGSATAASSTSTVDVSTTVAASCTINTATLAFTAYDPINTNASSPDDATGNIVIRCTKGASGITIDLGNGSHNGAGTQRQMAHTNGSVLLPYEIFRESTRAFVWGTGDNGSVYSGATLDGTGGDVQVTMYGRIPAAQLQAIAGSYSDTIVSTINF